MEPYQLHFAERALNELEQLDHSISRRILGRVQWLAQNLDSLSPQPLTGQFAGLFKFRVGDYRVIYEIVRDRRVIVVHCIGHRRDIYR
jgi:mRNA interferase RelE/StbE